MVAGLWGGIVGAINFTRYSRNEISGREALVSTASESVGAGLASSLGIVAGNVARAALLATAAATPLTFAVGVVVTAATKIAWDHAVTRQLVPRRPDRRPRRRRPGRDRG
jgi:hypothetical protein